MSRVSRYQGCIMNFMNKRSCLSNINETPQKDLFITYTKDSNYIFPILLLTILNNRNKKNKVQFQGYYAAVGVEFLKVIMDIISNSPNNTENYNKLVMNLIFMSMKSITQNIEIIKRHNDKILDSQSQIMDLIYNNMGVKGVSSDLNIVPCGKIKNDIYEYYFKDNNELAKKLSTFKMVPIHSLEELLKKRTCVLSELVISIAWILGSGQKDQYQQIKKLGKYFGYMYAISNDFKNIEKDINDTTDFTLNYVVNCGFQNSYNKFIDNKEKFIEGSMILDIYTSTLKELIEILENQIDVIIDKTSPDMVSSYSTLRTC